MSKDVFFQSSDYLFKLRAGYLIIKDNKILLARDYIGSYFYLPGGKIEFGETSCHSVKRELQEELNLKAKETELLFHEENFYYSQIFNSKVHEICFYYKVEVDLLEFMLQDEFELKENNLKTLYFKWINISDLAKIDFFPKSILNYFDL
ncbi:NUDIX hydrolase [Mycoplasmopsis bovirhinis]|uniref:Mutator mutT protein n=1 Tax=Mycoplasmopsis bovirhinis TaxID=29553 RepID=A0A449ACB8_9BACT|nr:NUDIX domain-containing protein [Mycoplasmopsis bovirhinis]VEU62491.1 mutator mutT protein [Mycoplasmopsis bovirhinis]